jgi:hypothetical protein
MQRNQTAQPDCNSLENKKSDGGQGGNRTSDRQIFSAGLKTSYVTEIAVEFSAVISNISARYRHLVA